jgi:hypothetical protein
VLDSGTPTPRVNNPPTVAQPAVNITGGSVTATTGYLGYTGGTFNYTHTASTPVAPFEMTNLAVGSNRTRQKRTPRMPGARGVLACWTTFAGNETAPHAIACGAVACLSAACRISASRTGSGGGRRAGRTSYAPSCGCRG